MKDNQPATKGEPTLIQQAEIKLAEDLKQYKIDRIAGLLNQKKRCQTEIISIEEEIVKVEKMTEINQVRDLDAKITDCGEMKGLIN